MLFRSDFAFNIHSGLGCQCTGGRVNGRNQKLNYKLRTGDTVEILTSPNQRPKLDWLAFTVTSKARNKIRVAIKEQESRGADLGKELLQRRFKNRKIELDESTLAKLVKKLNFKTATEFYTAIDAEQLDINTIIEKYLEIEHRAVETSERVSAEE